MPTNTTDSITINDVTTLHIDRSVAVIMIDSPPVNALSAPVRQGIAAALHEATDDTAVTAIVLMCAGRTFFAGADIREIGKPMAEPTLRQLQQQVENCPKPVIAAMHGSALGGGLELAMATHFRLALASTKFGFPEVKLGLLPGAGGTQRLPRLIGVGTALSMIIDGEPIEAREAERLGLVDRVVEDKDLFAWSIDFASRLVGPSLVPIRTRDKQSFWTNESDDAGASGKIAQLREQYRGFAAAQNIIESVTNASLMPFDEGIAAEATLFEQLKASPQSAALRYGFFAERQASKMPDLAEGEKVVRIERLDIRGSGLHAKFIADAAQSAGLTIATHVDPSDTDFADLLILTDITPTSVATSDYILLLDPAKFVAAVIPSGQLQGPSPVLEPIGIDLGDPEREPKSIELLAGDASAAVIAAILRLSRKLKLTGAVSKSRANPAGQRLRTARNDQISSLIADGVGLDQINRLLTGFGMSVITGLDSDWLDRPPTETQTCEHRDVEVLESILLAVANEAAALVDEAVVSRPSDIDVLAVKGMGWPDFEGGPLYWMDVRGLERTLMDMSHYEERFGGRFTPAPGLIQRVAENRSFVT